MTVETFMSQRGEVSPKFIEKVKGIVGEENVSESECDLISYSLDYWLYGIFLSQYGKLPALPAVVISPRSSEEIQSILRCANEYKVKITPFGGGSGVLGGAIPIEEGAILNLQRMNKFISLDETSLVAEFEGGIIGANLEQELNHRGYSMGNIPQSFYCSTLGDGFQHVLWDSSPQNTGKSRTWFWEWTWCFLTEILSISNRCQDAPRGLH